MTIVATTEDLRAWRNSQRRFAVLHEKKLSVLGSWHDVESVSNPAVKELLAEPAVTTP
jgi:ABC-type transporter Mla maintaining outer membrane lipid asymmetry ATPase subunit MlaF